MHIGRRHANMKTEAGVTEKQPKILAATETGEVCNRFFLTAFSRIP